MELLPFSSGAGPWKLYILLSVYIESIITQFLVLSITRRIIETQYVNSEIVVTHFTQITPKQARIRPFEPAGKGTGWKPLNFNR
jgi:hypothetical protein